MLRIRIIIIVSLISLQIILIFIALLKLNNSPIGQITQPSSYWWGKQRFREAVQPAKDHTARNKFNLHASPGFLPPPSPEFFPQYAVNIQFCFPPTKQKLYTTKIVKLQDKENIRLWNHFGNHQNRQLCKMSPLQNSQMEKLQGIQMLHFKFVLFL